MVTTSQTSRPSRRSSFSAFSVSSSATTAIFLIKAAFITLVVFGLVQFQTVALHRVRREIELALDNQYRGVGQKLTGQEIYSSNTGHPTASKALMLSIETVPEFVEITDTAVVDPLETVHLKRLELMRSHRIKNNKFLREKVAVAMKTGSGNAHTRLHAARYSWMSRVPNQLFIGDSSITTEDGVVIKNVLESVLDVGIKAKKIVVPPGLNGVEDLPGWRTDAFKNLPGFRLLYESYQQAEWFLMVDDDTYVFLDNLADFLRPRNSTLPQYIGEANKFIGCDGVQKFGDGPMFAQGGAGILLSRGAMMLLIDNMEKCTPKYDECWGGDIRLGLCMRDLGILVESVGDFHSRTIKHVGTNPTWVQDRPCSRPISFHKMAPQNILGLRQAEELSAQAGLALTMGTLRQWQLAANPTRFDQVAWTYPDTHVDGSQFLTFQSESTADCSRMCDVEESCRAWTRGPSGLCTLYDGWKERVAEQGHTSGVPFVCRLGD